MKRLVVWTILAALALFAVGCGSDGKAAGAPRQVSAAEAQKMMASEKDYIILDVRTKGEYGMGHIPKAINIANESIGTQPPAELPDKDQLILVYCRSGKRSHDAAQKLAAMGYGNVVDFGGIMDWPGEVVQD